MNLLKITLPERKCILFDTTYDLYTNKIFIHNLHCSITNIIHLLHPQHLLFSFELFRYIFFFRQLFYQPGKHFLCLLVNIRKITVQLAACEQIGVKYLAVLFEVTQMPLSPNAHWLLFFFGQ